MDDENDGAQAEAGVETCAPMPEFGGDEAGCERDSGAAEGHTGSLQPVSYQVMGAKQEICTIVQYTSLRV